MANFILLENGDFIEKEDSSGRLLLENQGGGGGGASISNQNKLINYEPVNIGIPGGVNIGGGFG